MSKASEKKDDQERAVAALRELFPKGSHVSTMVLHVSGSGMLRSIAVLAADVEGANGSELVVRNVSHLVARALGRPMHKSTAGVVMRGCGMDMGFALVYDLSATLYGMGDRGAYELKQHGL